MVSLQISKHSRWPENGKSVHGHEKSLSIHVCPSTRPHPTHSPSHLIPPHPRPLPLPHPTPPTPPHPRPLPHPIPPTPPHPIPPIPTPLSTASSSYPTPCHLALPIPPYPTYPTSVLCIPFTILLDAFLNHI